MIQKIIWLPIAQTTFTDALAYLEENFGSTEMQKFEDRVSQKIELLRINPKLGRKSNKRFDAYRTVIHKRIILFYQYKPTKKELRLLSFWNTRQDPASIRF